MHALGGGTLERIHRLSDTMTMANYSRHRALRRTAGFRLVVAAISRRTSVVLDLGVHDEQNPELGYWNDPWDGALLRRAGRVANAVVAEQSHRRWLRR